MKQVPFAGLPTTSTNSKMASRVRCGIDPIGSLIAMGLGWLIENLEPLKGWMNAVTGSADEVAGFAQTWTNIAAHLKATGEDLVVSMRRVEGLSGQAIDAYRALNGDAAAHIEASGRWAEGIAAGMQLASMIVGMVHDITRDAISMVVGTAISATITTVATVGFGAPVAAAQVATKVAQLAAKIGRLLPRLVRSLTQLTDLVKQLSRLFDDAGTGFRNPVPDAPAAGAPRTSSASPTPSGGSAPSYSRPSGHRAGVRDQVWNRNSVDGVVLDPLTGRVIDPAQPWHMGHRPGYEFRKLQRWAEENGLTRAEFLDLYNKPQHYWPELPASNVSHRGEDTSDLYLGP